LDRPVTSHIPFDDNYYVSSHQVDIVIEKIQDLFECFSLDPVN
jgi:hypothetical protein